MCENSCGGGCEVISNQCQINVPAARFWVQQQRWSISTINQYRRFDRCRIECKWALSSNEQIQNNWLADQNNWLAARKMHIHPYTRIDDDKAPYKGIVHLRDQSSSLNIYNTLQLTCSIWVFNSPFDVFGACNAKQAFVQMVLLQTYWHEVSGPIKAREAQSVHFAQEPADLVCHSNAFVLAFFLQ